jgi:hypothetical protein
MSPDILAGEIVSNIIQNQNLEIIPELDLKLLSISTKYNVSSQNTLKVTCCQIWQIPQENIWLCGDL